ncbi:MAG TPA: 30S ribosomal protein S9 [Methanocorpusculum sp.]|nr:30S ribosomal protein S9 [Methanocorpusculum sp.]
MKIINTSGKRKTAIARATLVEGTGKIRINSVPLEIYGNEIVRMKINEAIILASGVIDNIDINVNLSGGGVMAQAEAARTAIGRGILNWTNDPHIKEVYLGYDRTLLVNDSRQKESKKPNGRGARARSQKSYR